MGVKEMGMDILAVEVISAVGGTDNILAVTHCATRLRFSLKNDKEIDDNEVKAIDGVMGVSNKGGQYQLIIGSSVPSLYQEVESILNKHNDNVGEVSETTDEKKGLINTIFDVLSGTFVSIIPVLIAAGMISAVLSLLTTFGVVSAESPTYLVFSSIQSAIFYFLPIFAGYAAGQKLNMNPFVGMALGAILCFSTINGAEGLSIFGLGVAPVAYNSTVFPVILGVCLMSFIEKGLNKVIPDTLKTILIPSITLMIGVVGTLLVLGPIGSVVGTYLGSFISIVSDRVGWLAPGILALIYPVMIFTGMHYSLLPLVMTAFATNGFDPLLMVAGFIANLAEGGAASATAFLEKDKEKKAEATAIAISAICGITEPALFGITLRNRKTLIAVCLGGFAGALFAGIMSLKAFGFVGGLPSLPLFIGPSEGLDNLIVAIISVTIAFFTTFALTIILNKRGEQNA